MNILLLDRDHPLTRYNSRFWTVFSCRNGIFSPLERARRQHAGAEIFYSHPNRDYERLAANLMGVKPAGDDVPETDLTLDSADLSAATTLERLASAIAADLALCTGNGEEWQHKHANITLEGDAGDFYLHPSASASPGVIINVTDGPVIIDEGAKLSAFTYIVGPAYIGKHSHVDNCRMNGPCVVGDQCRVGGEIERSVIGDFSNKHHEGFLGHSLMGSWVNLGALTTTSDLKNNYGGISLALPDGTHPTGRIKFGSIISDCTKLAIGSMINTGSVLDTGGNIHGFRNIPKYTLPFAWGADGERYDLDRFLTDCEKIFARRAQTVTPAFREMATFLWQPGEQA